MTPEEIKEMNNQLTKAKQILMNQESEAHEISKRIGNRLSKIIGELEALQMLIENYE